MFQLRAISLCFVMAIAVGCSEDPVPVDADKVEALSLEVTHLREDVEYLNEQVDSLLTMQISDNKQAILVHEHIFGDKTNGDETIHR